MTSIATQLVTFIQNAIPPLQDGRYELQVTQTVPNQDPGSFPATATFVVQSERFTIAPTEIDSVFPPDNANGEFDGVFAQAVFTRRTLPWERELNTPLSKNTHVGAPWLAVLVCDDATAPKPKSVTAADLVPVDQLITVFDTPSVTGKGTLVATTLSYGTAVLGELEYGQAPTDPCTVVDLPIAMFNQIAPAALDMQYLAHIREVDTTGGRDSDNTSEQRAVVLTNRVPPTTGVARAFLVSLEGMGDYLPNADGSQSSAIGPTTTAVRLIAYQTWSFTANKMDQALLQLLEGLNAPPPNTTRVTTLTLPINGAAPDSTRIQMAMTNQANGTLASGDATVLMQNALLMGYVPMNHHLRHGDNTVSFYRGPLVPFSVPSKAPSYYSGPDAANGYNPQTGLFDVSYGAAWQLGQWLMLQSVGIANQLYQWKQQVTTQQALAAEQTILTQRLGGQKNLLPRIAGKYLGASTDPPAIPEAVTAWFQSLASLQGVPFNYLVPDERMLPPESLRFFYVDANWIDALIDGAFSIGRNATSPTSIEAVHARRMRAMARSGPPRAANRKLAAAATGTAITGFVLRSQAVSGWPNLRVVGFTDTGANTEVPLLRSVQLSSDTLICFFPDVLAAVYLREPPEQMHHGLSVQSGHYGIELRSVIGGPGSIPPGKEYPAPGGWAPVTMRADNMTLVVASTAASVQDTLQTQFSQSFPQGFTSAEFALEFTKGVVEVEYQS
jgi:hypothetical protein